MGFKQNDYPENFKDLSLSERIEAIKEISRKKREYQYEVRNLEDLTKHKCPLTGLPNTRLYHCYLNSVM